MLLSSSTSQYLRHGFSCEETVEIMYKAGYAAMDFSFHISPEYCGEQTDSPEFTERFLALRALAESKVMVFNQAHSPRNSCAIWIPSTAILLLLVLTSVTHLSSVLIPQRSKGAW